MAETFDAAVFSSYGTARDTVTLPTDPFDGTVNMPVMHQAVKAFLANQRQGNAATKIRKYVVGGNQKPWKQKGTGRARQGSTRAPQWVGGGTVFGPIPRSYAQYVPRQVRALARRSAFNARVREGAVMLVDAFQYETPSTQRLAGLVDALGLNGKKVLILTDGVKSALHLSGRNLPTVHVMPYSDVSTYHILWSDTVVIEASAVGHTMEPLPEPAPGVPADKAKKVKNVAAVKRDAPAKAEGKVKAKAAKKVVKKAAAKKAAPAAKKAAAKKTAKKAAAKKSAPKKKKGK